MLYQKDRLAHVEEKLFNTVWQTEKPACLDIDVALASLSDKIRYYAVPGVQEPGLLTEGSMGSIREEINHGLNTHDGS